MTLLSTSIYVYMTTVLYLAAAGGLLGSYGFDNVVDERYSNAVFDTHLVTAAECAGHCA